MDVSKLDSLAQDKTCGLVVQKTKIHMSLQPKALQAINAKVKEELESRLFQYHKDFDGMLIHFSDVAVIKSGGSVHIDEEGYPHINVRLKAYIFRPLKGMEIDANVYDYHNNIIECRVFSDITITAYINEFQIKGEVNSGDLIKVQLTEVNHQGHFTRLAGTIKEIVHLQTTTVKKKNKKKTFSEDDGNAEENIPDDLPETAVVKKNKRKTFSEDDGNDDSINNNVKSEVMSDDAATTDLSEPTHHIVNENSDSDITKEPPQKKRKTKKSHRESLAPPHG